MNPSPIVRLLLLISLLVLGSGALGQADPPGRVGRLNHAEGTVTFAPAGDNEWTEVPLNRPLTRGDRIWTDRGSRAELQVGSSAVRLDGQTRLDLLELDDHSTKLSLTQGTAYVRVRSLPEGENFEIDTPNLAYRVAYPGDYRVDVDANLATTRVTIHSGTGAVYGESGQAFPLGGGQQVTFRGRALAQLEARESPPQDAFDRWAAERNRREDQSIAARYVPREVVGYQQLDPHGNWVRHATHGAIWFPQGMPADWAPYRYGRWEWIAPWGWTWMDDAPWGFAPSHYGRWTRESGRWAWVPGRLSLRPVYAPALVAFVGGSRGLLPGASTSEVSWFPLGPGEMWQPGFRASISYLSNVNRNMVPGTSDSTYAYQRTREALTSLSGEDFHRGRPAAAGWLKLAALTLANPSVVPPPPMPERSAAVTRDRGPTVRAAPAAPPPVQQVIASANIAAAPPPDNATRAAAAAPGPAAAAPPEAHARPQSAASSPRAPQPGRGAAASPASPAAKAPTPALPTTPAGAKTTPPAPPQPAVVTQGRSEARTLPAADPAPARAKAELQARAERTRRAEAAAAAAKAQAESAARQAAAARAEAQLREQQARRVQLQKREQALARAAESRREQAQRAERGRREQSVAARTEQARREQVARPELDRRAQASRQVEAARREAQARQVEAARREAQARQVEAARREAQARQAEANRRDAQARREEQLRRDAVARREEQQQRLARNSQLEQVRRVAEQEAQVLRQQRVQRDEQARRAAQDREQAQRDAWQRQQQAIAEQWRRDQQGWEQQQRELPRRRPDLRPDLRDDPRARPPEVWQRGIPILNPGRTS